MAIVEVPGARIRYREPPYAGEATDEQLVEYLAGAIGPHAFDRGRISSSQATKLFAIRSAIFCPRRYRSVNDAELKELAKQIPETIIFAGSSPSSALPFINTC